MSWTAECENLVPTSQHVGPRVTYLGRAGGGEEAARASAHREQHHRTEYDGPPSIAFPGIDPTTLRSQGVGGLEGLRGLYRGGGSAPEVKHQSLLRKVSTTRRGGASGDTAE